jgi:hypothetical protein
MTRELIRLLTVTVPCGESMLCTIGNTSHAQRYLTLITAASDAADLPLQLAAPKRIPDISNIERTDLFVFLNGRMDANIPYKITT